MSIVEPLNLENLLIFTFAGNLELFTFIALIAISALAARFRMPDFLFGLMVLLFALIFNTYLGGLYIIILTVTSLVVFNIVARFFR